MCAVSSKLVEVEVNNQTCSNVLAHRGRLSIGRTRTAEAPVSIPGPQASHHSRSPWLRGVLYPDLVGGWTFRSASEVQPVAVRFDNKDEDTIHDLKVRARKQMVRIDFSYTTVLKRTLSKVYSPHMNPRASQVETVLV